MNEPPFDLSQRPYPIVFLTAFHFVSLLSLFFVFAASPNTHEALTRPSSLERLQYVDDIDGDASRLEKHFDVQGDFKLLNYGLGLLPGTTGTLVYEGTKQPEETPLLRVWLPFGAEAPTTVSLCSGNTTESNVFAQTIHGGTVKPTALDTGFTTFTITLQFGVPVELQKGALVLDRLEIATQIHNPGFLDTSVALRCVLIAWPYLLLVAGTPLFLLNRGMSRRGPPWPIGGVALAAAVGVCAFMMQPEYSSIGEGTLNDTLQWITLSLIIFGCAAMIWPRTRHLWGLRAFTVLATMLLCLHFRWIIVTISAISVPMPDTQTYLMLAQRMTHLFDTEFREPLFLWVTWLAQRVFATGTTSLLFTTFLLGVTVIVPLYALSRKFVPPTVAILVCLAYGFNPGLSINSSLGLREELLPLGLLMVLLAVYELLRRGKVFAIDAPTSSSNSPLTRPSRFVAWIQGEWPTLLLIAAGVACFMTRLNMIVFLAAFLFALLLIMRAQWRRWVLVGVVWMICLAPQLMYAKNKYSDAFHGINFAAAYFRNLEFADKPGFLTRTEVNQNPYGGPQLSMGQYVFGMHSFGDVVATHVAGLWEMVNPTMAGARLLRMEKTAYMDDRMNVISRVAPPRIHERAIYALFLFGFVAVWFVPRGWIILMAWFLVQAPLAFVFGKKLADERLLYNGVPLMLIMAGIGLWQIIGFARRFMPHVKPPALPAPQQ